MQRIDAHQHFWKFDPVRDAWITSEMEVIATDFMPIDLRPHLKEFKLDGCIVVQSDESKEENLFQLNNATENDFVKGVVGWIDFEAKDLEEQLQEYSKHPLMKGFRHMCLQGSSDRAMLLSSTFKYGMFCLEKYGFTYDLLILP